MPTDVRNTTLCYLSTPEHVQSFCGRFIWIYTGKGEIELLPDVLIWECSGFSFKIPLAAISAIELGEYSRWAKPFGLNYIAVTYQDEDIKRTVLLTPTRRPGWNVACWETNKVVVQWMETLRDAVACST